jgi:transposase-like protein
VPDDVPQRYKTYAASVQAGNTSREVAEIYGVSVATVQRACARLGVERLGHRRPKFTTEEAWALYERHQSITVVARELGVSRQAITRRFQKDGCTTNWDARGHRYDEDEKWAAVRMYEDGEAVADIEAATGMHSSTIRRLARQQGVKIRDLGPIPKLTYEEARDAVERWGSHQSAADVLGVASSTVTRTLWQGRCAEMAKDAAE